jgi:hypothetical protein
MNDAIALGSVFPDMVIGDGIHRDLSHYCGFEILEFLRPHHELLDFALANITHGVNPTGLDYFGDEINPFYERGYCFEKGRVLIEPTISACNIPPEMGWWKAHNIIEMGIEMQVSALGNYGRHLQSAFNNRDLVEIICERMGAFFAQGPLSFIKRVSDFSVYIDLSTSTAESLAAKYDYQMYYKHCIHINMAEVANLIRQAAGVVEDDLEEFFRFVSGKVKKHILASISGKVLKPGAGIQK